MPYGWAGNCRLLASHWQRVTDFCGLSNYGFNCLRKRDEHSAYIPVRGRPMAHFAYLIVTCNTLSGKVSNTQCEEQGIVDIRIRPRSITAPDKPLSCRLCLAIICKHDPQNGSTQRRQRRNVICEICCRTDRETMTNRHTHRNTPFPSGDEVKVKLLQLFDAMRIFVATLLDCRLQSQNSIACHIII